MQLTFAKFMSAPLSRKYSIQPFFEGKRPAFSVSNKSLRMVVDSGSPFCRVVPVLKQISSVETPWSIKYLWRDSKPHY